MEPEPNDLIPGVEDRELIGAMRSLASVPPSSLPDEGRFAREVHRIAEARCQSGWRGEDESDVAVFLLSRYPREDGGRFGATPVSDLIASGRPVLGKLFFLNKDASSGRGVNLPVEPDCMVDWLIDEGFGEQPSIFIYRQKGLMLVRGDGAKSELTQREIIRDAPPVANLEQIRNALRHLHSNYLLTPSACPKGVWEERRAAQYVPGPLPEKAIQREVGTNLSSWFQGLLRTEWEAAISIGRIDVRLLQLGEDGRWCYWAILELKVIRSSHNARKGAKAKRVSIADNAEAVAEGVRQAFSFGRDQRTEALLEVFDLRQDKTNDVLKHQAVLDALARCSPNPYCRIWPLFGSASDARRAGF